MSKSLIFLALILSMVFISMFVIGGYSYQKFTASLPASFSSTQDVEFYLPVLINWDPINQKKSAQSTIIEYYLDTDLREFQGGYDSMFVTINKAKRTAPFTFQELDRTKTLSRGKIRYSVPVISKDPDYATILFTVRGLDGFFTLRAPVNFPAQCSIQDTKTIVASILTSFAAQSSGNVSDIVMRMKVWQVERSLEWPEPTSSCF